MTGCGMMLGSLARNTLVYCGREGLCPSCAAALQKRMEELEHILTNAGMCELATKNVNLESYMREWEQRAEQAEARAERLNKTVGTLRSDLCDTRIRWENAMTLLKQKTEDAKAGWSQAHLLREALEAVEWVSSDTHEYCPWCQGVEPGKEWREEQMVGHAPDCKRQQALSHDAETKP